MVKVVVSLSELTGVREWIRHQVQDGIETHSDQRSKNVIPRRVAIIERLITQPMGKAVDAESGLLDEEDPEDARVDVASPPIAPAESGYQSWETTTESAPSSFCNFLNALTSSP